MALVPKKPKYFGWLCIPVQAVLAGAVTSIGILKDTMPAASSLPYSPSHYLSSYFIYYSTTRTVEDTIQLTADMRIAKQPTIDDAVDQTRAHELGRWLSPPDASINHTAHHKSPPIWFFESKDCNRWKSTPYPLWIDGKPGSGKTELCSSIVKHVKALRNARLAYFFFDPRDENKQSCNSLLRSLLFQLSTQSHHLFDILAHLHSVYEDGKRQPSDGTFTRCLKKMLSHPSQDPIYLIIDGVDVCPDSSGSGPSARGQVLKLIDELVGLGLPNVHICVSSRLEVGKCTVFKDSTILSVTLHEQVGHKEYIDDYVKSIVYSDPKMGSLSEKEKIRVVETLTKKSDGVFQLARCQLESLRRNPGLSSDLGRVLHELPVTLDQSYEQILHSIDKANREHAHRLLQYLTVAIRPLRVEELAQVHAVDFDTAGRAGIRIPKVSSADQRTMSILSTLSSLISIDSRVVQLSHLSVKEFLTSERLANSRRDVSRYHISLQSAHTTLAQACLGILLCLDDHSSRSSIGDFPFAQYAANHWDDHVRFERVSSDPRIRDSIEYFLDGNKSHWKAWHRLRDDNKSLSLSPGDSQVPLFHAAFYGLYGTVELLIAKHPQHVNPRSHSAASPLIAALIRSRFDVAELLYYHRAKVNFQDETQSTLLHVASQVPDHVAPVVEILEWLLAHGADVHARDANDKTPLHLAAEKGLVDTVRTLVMHKSDIKARDRDGRTPLHVAVDRRSLEVVHTLILHKADVNSRDKTGKTPLHVAVHRQHFDISRMLIEHKASVNERDEEGKTPLHLAAKWEHPDIARMLINHRAHVNEGDDEGMTPLHVAVHHGRHNIVQTLIKHNANLNVRNNKGHTPLFVARDLDHHDIAQMLREHSTHTKIQASPLRRVTLNMEFDDANARHASPASVLKWLPSLRP